MFTKKKIELRQPLQKSTNKLCNPSVEPVRPVPYRQFSDSVPGHAVVSNAIKMAAFTVRFTEHLHFNQVSSSVFTNTCPSYEFLTTVLINLTMEGTLSEINNQFCWQVNKGVLGIDHQYLRDKATAVRRSTGCLERQSCVHKVEIIRDKTAWQRT